MEHGDGFFNLPSCCDDYIFSMKISDDVSTLTAVACPIDKLDKINIDRIDNSIDFTTDSIFSGKAYCSIFLEEQ